MTEFVVTEPHRGAILPMTSTTSPWTNRGSGVLLENVRNNALVLLEEVRRAVRGPQAIRL